MAWAPRDPVDRTEGEHARRSPSPVDSRTASVRIVDRVTEEYLASARKTMDDESAAQELVERTGG
ncbi:hypothetical protein WSS_A06194 [Rhodococcus opacus M213]|uniref:Uncharacterized protein n=1 Tax=Rhodococcus opacus M213 TaxID=1129896 RepID=K8XZ28_RHOOP|nr:hypothetical protein WSS_A06194 [Rhodococcus opacus M213]